MISCPIKTVSGADAGSYEFDPAELVRRHGDKPLISKQLLHDVCVMYEANKRVGTVRTKTRGEVAGSTKKMFRQKGTGNARMGSRRSPVRVGGGDTFAKRPRDYSYSLPKKAVRLATRMALLSKFQDDEAVVLDSLVVSEPKTRPIADMLNAVGVGRKTALLLINEADPVLWKSARNIASLWVRPATQVNAYDLLHQRHLIVTKDAMDSLLASAGEAAAAA